MLIPFHRVSWHGRKGKGFTLIELVTVMAIIAMLLGLAVPSFSRWINNAKVRTGAETLQNALRLAQAEAIKRSHQVAFVLTNATAAESALPVANGQNWYIQVLPTVAGETVDAAYVQGGSVGNQTNGISVTGPAIICFNSIGVLVANAATGIGTNCTAPTDVVTYDISRSGADRQLEVQVSPTGAVRMCDKSKTLSTTTPDGC